MKTMRCENMFVLLVFLFLPSKIGNISSREGCYQCVDQDRSPKGRMEEFEPRLREVSGVKSSTFDGLVNLWTVLKSIGRYRSKRDFQKQHPLVQSVKLINMGRIALYLSVIIVLTCLPISGLYKDNRMNEEDADDSPYKKENYGYDFIFGFQGMYNNTATVVPCNKHTVETMTAESCENCDERRTAIHSSTPGTDEDTTCNDAQASSRDVSGSCGDVNVSCDGASATHHKACNETPSSSHERLCFDGTTLSKVNHPEYVDQRAREESFRDWSRSKGPDPATLADAGFYSIGSGSAVRCFCCGGGLSDLHPDSNPYVDHLKLYPRCEYISRHPNGNKRYGANGTAGTSTLDKVTKTTDSNNDIEPKTSPNPQERKSTLTYDEIKSLLEMGFKRSLIEDLICRQLSNEQNDVTTNSIIEELISDEPANIAAKVEEKYTEKPSLASNEQAKNPKRKKQHAKNRDTTNTPQKNGALNSIKKEDSVKTAAKLPANGDSVDHIKQENRELKEQLLCKICLDRTSCVVFLDCGHMVSCPMCAPSLRKCPICRKLVKGRIQVQ